MWELGKWMVSRTESGFFMFMFFAFIVPGATGGFFVGGFISVVFGAALFEQLSRKRAGTCLAMLPIPSQQTTRFLWFITIVFAPIVYGVIQVPIRMGAVFAGEGSWGWVALILPECIIAMGFAALIPLGRGMTSAAGTPSSAFEIEWSMKEFMSVLAFLGVMGAGWILNRNEGIRHPAYAASACAAVALVAMSYSFADRAVGINRLTRRTGSGTSPTRICRIDRFRKSGASTFFGLWLRQLAYGLYYLLALAVFIPVYIYTSDVDLNSQLPSGAIIFPMVLSQMHVLSLKDLDYRAIRSLPLRRSRQVLLILSLILPFLMPISVALLGATAYAGWPLPNAIGFVVALGGCCAVGLALSSVFGHFLGYLAGSVSTLPIALTFWYWHSPWALLLYAVFAALLWLGSYVYMFDQLCGDGAIYGKRDVIGDVVAGQE
jgi:hypothetical protein